MSSRRPYAAAAENEKTEFPVEPVSALRPATGTSNITPAVPATVIYKLIAFTFGMIAIPISTYFLTVNTLFKGNTTYAGALAAIMANVVLIGYIIAAVQEDQGDPKAKSNAGKAGKKDL